MTVFVLGKAWLIAVIAGLIFLLPKESRILSAHLLLGSTFGLILAFVGSGIVSFILGSAKDSDVFWIPIAMILGSILGVVVGSRLARRVNLALGWKHLK
jgi:uncharacterized membrane protein YfcA